MRIKAFKLSRLTGKRIEARKPTIYIIKDPFAKRSVPVKVILSSEFGEDVRFYYARGATHSVCSIRGGE